MKDRIVGSIITLAVILIAAAGIWFALFMPKKFDTAVVKKSDIQEVIKETGTVASNHSKSYYCDEDSTVILSNTKIGNHFDANETVLTLRPAGQSLSDDNSENDTVISSEFAGVLTELVVEDGMIIPAKTKLFTVSSNSDVSVLLDMPQKDIAKFSLSQKAEVKIDDNTYSGKVNRISNIASVVTGKPKVLVEISISKPDKHVLLGVEADVEIYTKSKDSAIVVPVEAVYSDSDHDFVYAIEESKVLRKTVTTGISSKNFTEIKDGLLSGDVVITGAVSDSDRGTRAASY